MDSGTTVFFVGIGGPATIGATEALRSDPSRAWRVVGCDLDPNAGLTAAPDAFWPVPPRSAPGYVDLVLGLAEQAGTDVLYPNPTADQCIFASQRATVESRGMALVASPVEALEIATDKYRTLTFARDIGLAVPETILVQQPEEVLPAARELGYPKRSVCVKPLEGAGATGFRVFDPEADMGSVIFAAVPGSNRLTPEIYTEMVTGSPAWRPVMVSEYLPGTEREVDLLVHDGQLVTAVVRHFYGLYGGMATECELVEDPGLVERATHLVQQIGLQHINGVAFRENAAGEPCVLEINPRMTGSIGVAVAGGVNMPAYAIRLALGEELGELPQPRIGTRMVRTWREVYTHGGLS